MEWVASLRGKIVGASFFLTNDARLPSLSGLETLILDDLKKGS